MRRSIVLLGVLLSVAVVLASCDRATLRTGTGVIELYPTAKPLTGPIPVGRWMCFFLFDYEAIKMTNSGRVPRLCQLYDSFYESAEFNPDGTGWLLDQWQRGSSGIPDNAFQITGRSLLYVRKSEFRWMEQQDGALLVQLRSEYVGDVEEITSDVFLLSPHVSYLSRRLMIRIGSEAHRGMANLINCVAANNRRKLFELETCEAPPFTVPER